MKIIHFADAHLGVETYGKLNPQTGLNTRVEDFLHALDEIVHYAIEFKCDAVLFAGDAYKTREPNPTLQREFAKRMKRLSDCGIIVMMIPGNHDTPVALGRSHSLGVFSVLGGQNIKVCYEGYYVIDTKSGPLQIVSLPWPTRSNLLARNECDGLSLIQINTLMQERIRTLLEESFAKCEPRYPTIVLGHVTIAGSIYGSERIAFIGHELVLPLDIFRQFNVDYVALGHIHKQQMLCLDPPVVYSGSIERVDFGEVHDEKGFMEVILAPGTKPVVTFIPVHSRPMVDVEVTCNHDNLVDVFQKAVSQTAVKDAIVRVILHVHSEESTTLPDKLIYEILAEAHCVARIIRDIPREQRQRLPTETDVLAQSPLDALRIYLGTKEDLPEQRVTQLMDMATQIVTANGGVK